MRLDLDQRGRAWFVGGLLVIKRILSVGALIYGLGYILATFVGLIVGGWFISQHGLNGAMPALIDFYCQYSEVACEYLSIK